MDLFESRHSRTDLMDIYIDLHVGYRGFPPKDYANLGRAGLVDRIERLVEEFSVI
jgi:hypothetical protein